MKNLLKSASAQNFAEFLFMSPESPGENVEQVVASNDVEEINLDNLSKLENKILKKELDPNGEVSDILENIDQKINIIDFSMDGPNGIKVLANQALQQQYSERAGLEVNVDGKMTEEPKLSEDGKSIIVTLEVRSDTVGLESRMAYARLQNPDASEKDVIDIAKKMVVKETIALNVDDVEKVDDINLARQYQQNKNEDPALQPNLYTEETVAYNEEL